MIGMPITSILRDELRLTYWRLDMPYAAISPKNRISLTLINLC